MLLPLWQDEAIQKAWARKSEFQVGLLPFSVQTAFTSLGAHS